MFFKLLNMEVYAGRCLFPCTDCNKAVCALKDKDDLVICFKGKGKLVVSRVNQGRTTNRRVQETRLGDASTNDDGVLVYLKDVPGGNPCDGKGRRGLSGNHQCQCEP